MTLETKEIIKPNFYCSNKNCSLPSPETLNRLHKESKLTWEKIAKDIYKVSERTLRRHARQSIKESQKIKQKRGRKRKIDGILLDWLRECVIALNKIKVTSQRYLAELFDCSQSTICTSLKRARVVYKGFTYQSIEQLRLKNRAKINYFINVTLPYLISIGANIFFLDETGFRCNMTLRRGYGWKGLPIIKQKSGIRGKNQTLMLLAQISDSVEKIIHWDLMEGGMKTPHFHEFLTKFNPPNNGKKNVLIMDNLPVHKAGKIAELLTSKNVNLETFAAPLYTTGINVSKNKKLKVITISSSTNTISSDLNIFSHLTELEHLDLGMVNKPSNDFCGSLKALENCKKLEFLCIGQNRKIIGGLEYLPLEKLKRFGCYGTVFQDQLRPFDYDIFAWKLVNYPNLITNLDIKQAIIEGIEQTKQIMDDIKNKKCNLNCNPEKESGCNCGGHYQECLASVYDRSKRISRLESKIKLLEEEIASAKSQKNQQTQTDLTGEQVETALEIQRQVQLLAKK